MRPPMQPTPSYVLLHVPWYKLYLPLFTLGAALPIHGFDQHQWVSNGIPD